MRRLRHDMRTPLGQIIGYSELVEEEVSDRGLDDLIPDLTKIRDAAQILLRLVDVYFSGEPLPSDAEISTVAEEGAEAGRSISSGTRVSMSRSSTS